MKFNPDKIDDSIAPSLSSDEYNEEVYDTVENLTSIPITPSTEGKNFFNPVSLTTLIGL